MNQLNFAIYPDVPGSKKRETSHAAGVEMRSKAGSLRVRAMVCFFEHRDGLTADEVAGRLNESVLAIRPRITELSVMGMIKDLGIRRKNLSGHNAIVWGAVK